MMMIMVVIVVVTTMSGCCPEKEGEEGSRGERVTRARLNSGLEQSSVENGCGGSASYTKLSN